jgi:signal transduction histidine kinase
VGPSDMVTTRQTQDRLHSLIVVKRAIVAELSLDSLLRVIVESARRVVDAQYAVLEVIGPDGALEQFIQSGVDLRSAGPPTDEGPVGGLSFLAPDGPLPLRRWFPEPAATSAAVAVDGVRSLLGVPVHSASRTHGNLFLARWVDGQGFSEEDERIVTALVATAGIAIENARLYEESQRREEWLTASTEISQRLLAGDVEVGEVLGSIAATVQQLARADLVSIVLADPFEPGMLAVAASCGEGAEQLRQLRYPVEGSIAWRAMQAGHGLLARDRCQERSGIYAALRPIVAASDVMALPFRGIARMQGAILAMRINPTPFTETDLELAQGFAGQAALALELVDTRREQQQLAVLEDRARIARDLHDHVVQKLFAAGLTLKGAISTVRNPALSSRLDTAVEHLDETIRSIRTSIFELQTPRALSTSVRGRLLAAVNELAPVLGFSPTLEVEGPVDSLLSKGLAAAVDSVLREAVANVALHADATSADVRLMTDGRLLAVTVSDNGHGLPADVELSGLRSLRQRAEELGGHLELDASREGGVLLTWTVPV